MLPGVKEGVWVWEVVTPSSSPLLPLHPKKNKKKPFPPSASSPKLVTSLGFGFAPPFPLQLEEKEKLSKTKIFFT